MKIDFANPVFRSAIYGIEREALRVTPEGMLALTPHPAAFGDKLKNKRITTDFSESQVEMITPPMAGIARAERCLEELFEYTASRLEGGELLWPLSLPCRVPKGTSIPIARYEGEEGRKAMAYRQRLLERYGGKIQLISGIHFNFSLPEAALLELQRQWKDRRPLAAFRNDVYLKIARNYLRYGFAVVSLLGCSNVADESFEQRVLEKLERRDKNSYLLKDGISLRNSRWGYQNSEALYPDYSSVEAYMSSVEGFVDRGLLSEPKELYAIVRPKSEQMGWAQMREGIAYLELRNIDIDPEVKTGISGEAIRFLHLFLLLMLERPESDFGNWQQEGRENLRRVAEKGLFQGLMLEREGRPIAYQAYMEELLEGVNGIAARLGLPAVTLRPGEKAMRMAERPFLAFGLEKAQAYCRDAQLADPVC